MFTSASRKIIPALALELLGSIVGRIHDFCGVLEEENLRTNFVLIYELIDEIIVSGSIISFHIKDTTFFVNLLTLSCHFNALIGLWPSTVNGLRGFKALRDIRSGETIQWHVGLLGLADSFGQTAAHRQCQRKRI